MTTVSDPTVTRPGAAAGSGGSSPEPPVGRTRRWRRGGWLLAGLVVALLATAVAGAGIGQLAISPMEILGSISHRLGLDLGRMPTDPQGDNALWQVRFPRVTLAILVGACLGSAGAMMQGVFGNPLAEPGVIGVSAGAAMGAATVLALGVSLPGGVAAAAFLGGLIATGTVYLLSRSGGRTEVVTLVLTGVAINAVAGAGIGLLMHLTDNDGVRAIAFWNLGSLAQATWTAVAIVAPCAAVGLAVSAGYARRLDLLALGERPAAHLGVNVERMRLVLIATTALLTAAAVAFTGVISFVGLVVPHIVRMVAGPGHRILLPASALGGAIVVVAADLVARNLVPYQELPLGVLTSLVGGPFFFWLLHRTRSRAGGWA